jgi:isopropylmalate/homocitrate/citramalate synthase
MKIIECPRDAIQGMETFIPTEKKIKYLNSILNLGFDTIDFGSFVSAKAIPQLRDTAEVLAGLDLNEGSSKLLAIIANLRGATDACHFEEINFLGFPFSISETFQQRNTNTSIAESLVNLTAIQNLIDAIGSDTNLSKLKTTITAFQTTIVAAIGKQKTALQKTGLDSDDVETNRIAMCIAQYANLGAMMLQFATTPEVIEPYFDLKNIRQEIQTVFTKELKPSEVYFIAKRSFKADDVLEFDNIGNTEISFYIADKKDATTGTVIINVPAEKIKV